MIVMISEFLFVEIKHICIKSLKLVFTIKYLDVCGIYCSKQASFFGPSSLTIKPFANSIDGRTFIKIVVRRA